MGSMTSLPPFFPQNALAHSLFKPADVKNANPNQIAKVDNNNDDDNNPRTCKCSSCPGLHRPGQHRPGQPNPGASVRLVALRAHTTRIPRKAIAAAIVIGVSCSFLDEEIPRALASLSLALIGPPSSSRGIQAKLSPWILSVPFPATHAAAHSRGLSV
jgi:hypothetical protein